MDVTVSEDLIVSNTLDYCNDSNSGASNNTDGYDDDLNPVIIIAEALFGIFIVTCNLFTLITNKCSRLAREHNAKLVTSLCVADFSTGCVVIYITFEQWLLDPVNDWFKHILLVNTKGSGVAKLRRKPSPTYTHTFTPLNTYYQEKRYQITYTICIP